MVQREERQRIKVRHSAVTTMSKQLHPVGKLWEISLTMLHNYPTQKARELWYLYSNS